MTRPYRPHDSVEVPGPIVVLQGLNVILGFLVLIVLIILVIAQLGGLDEIGVVLGTAGVLALFAIIFPGLLTLRLAALLARRGTEYPLRTAFREIRRISSNVLDLIADLS